ncbi:thymidylate kinase [Aurantiacibacter atlanticus]|uniref:Thymidylate kinase n=1 Tax=Aurantiacibacter atlanticus TaxID=1648404 RepID=A0A0H4VCB5_9SPHN|nr:dTMP kinase [Aurantiacibacter atlanticus]AKQ42297.1 thymidylate kinase [Aurantiacibacter atlanticus]MDF1835047.1 dTMP kinase [Alteraurantiacibacter sp. bin_em_oilr2.035]
MTSGRFITLEGGEGVGKSTQARMLSEALITRGLGVLLTREPGGTPGAEAIRKLLLDTQFNWDARAEALLFAAARSDHVDHAIRPALDRGEWVVCDRFIDSSRAYQAGGGNSSDDAILAMHTIGSHGLMPDVTFLLVAETPEISARLAARDGDNQDRIGGKPEAYHGRVETRFRDLAAMDAKRFVLIDASGSPAEVHGRIMEAMEPLLGEGG